MKSTKKFILWSFCMYMAVVQIQEVACAFQYSRGREPAVSCLSCTSGKDPPKSSPYIKNFLNGRTQSTMHLKLPPGSQDGFFVVQEYTLSSDVDLRPIEELLGHQKFQRLQLQPNNITIPVALFLLDRNRYPSLSRARKEIRQGKIVRILEGGILVKATVGDRIASGTRIGRQEAEATILHYESNSTSPFWTMAKPSFNLPVVYEDDHMAIVNKPAGVLVYAEGGKGRNNVRFTLLHVLQAPSQETDNVLNRPEVVHRLDFATSGLLVVGKTKTALRHLSQQFEHRLVQKTYTAIVSKRWVLNNNTEITSRQASELGFRIDGEDNDGGFWNLIDAPLDGKQAITLWRTSSTQGFNQDGDEYSVLELKPQTGRYHQLRRHMAWNLESPIVGDPIYGRIKTDLDKRFHRGLLLCSNRITLQHPHYNTPDGRKQFLETFCSRECCCSGAAASLCLEDEDDTVYVNASIALPAKFEKFLRSKRRIARYALDEIKSNVPPGKSNRN